MRNASNLIGLCALLWCACIDTGPQRTALALSVAGADAAGPFTVDADWQVTLDNAQLAFGPLYLCGGTQAGALCETARAEWLDSVVVDALDPAAAQVGTMDALTGAVRSWMYDLGIVSLLTRPEPVGLSAAEALGGYSVRLSGTASRGADVIEFSAALAIQQDTGTETGVPVVRSAPSAAFEHELGEQDRLTVRFDPRPWLDTIDFDQLCDAALGCPTEVELEPGSQASRAIRNQLVAGPRPSFDFGP